MTASLVVYIIIGIINIIAFALVGVDKKRSRQEGDRVPEVYLFFIAVFFASLGVLLGMYYFHNKTRKFYFPLGMLILLIEQSLLLLYFIGYLKNF